MEDRRQFFSQHKQSGRFGQRLVLAMQLAQCCCTDPQLALLAG